jgi:hypothetical protein
MSATELRFGRAPGAWPLLGHVAALQRRPLALLDSLPAHGDLVEIRLGPRPAYVVCHPGLARQVLTDLRGFDRTGLVSDRVRTAMGNGLASAAHQDHRRQRSAETPGPRTHPASLTAFGAGHAAAGTSPAPAAGVRGSFSRLAAGLLPASWSG